MKGLKALMVAGGIAVLSATTLGGTFSVAQAAGGAEVIAQRQAVMKSIGAHMGGIVGAMKAGNGKGVAGHAMAINALAKVMPGFFPKGSGPEAGKTRALPKIWQEWAKFVQVTKTLDAESAKLAQVAGGGDMAAVGAQFKKMGGMGCGGCHKPFRAPKK